MGILLFVLIIYVSILASENDSVGFLTSKIMAIPFK